MVSIQRPVMMNGIGTLVTAQDLLERSICIELPIIQEGNRRTDGELSQYFENSRAEIFGGILTIMSKALELLPTIPNDNLPRMADFVLLGRAVAAAMGREPSEFDRCYSENQQRALEKTLEACPIYSALKKLIQHHTQGFLGIYSDLLQTLERYVEYKPQHWPKTPKALAAMLKRQATPLRKVGINVKWLDKRSDAGYLVAIDRIA